MNVTPSSSVKTIQVTAFTAALLSVRPSPIQFDWGTDSLVLWIEDLSPVGTLLDQMAEVIDRIGFAIELHTGWDHRTDTDTYHPLFGYRLLFRDATGLWHGVQVSPAGQFIGTTPLEEMNYEIAYDKVMWVD
jgi:hypothetical protein